jgi:hypothetical protein
MFFLYFFSVLAALILTVLFVPVRYRADISVTGDSSLGFSVSWLFKFLHVYFGYKKKRPDFTFRVFGIRVGKKIKRKMKKKDEKREYKHLSPWENDVVVSVREIGGKVRGLLTDQTGKINISSLITFIKQAWDTLKPRDISAEGTFGFDNPADTGFFLGIINIILDFYNLGGSVRVTGDFVDQTLSLKIRFTGHFNLKSLVTLFMRLQAIESNE